jgi:hypothetical protein
MSWLKRLFIGIISDSTLASPDSRRPRSKDDGTGRIVVVRRNGQLKRFRINRYGEIFEA